MKQDNTNQQDNEQLDMQLEMQAKQIAGLLDANANRLSMRTLKQLENGRARAVKAHSQQLSGATVNADGTLSHLSSWAAHHRLLASGLILATVFSGFLMIQSYSANESSDAFLLGAELPPEAFVDKGFEPSLNVQVAYLQHKK